MRYRPHFIRFPGENSETVFSPGRLTLPPLHAGVRRSFPALRRHGFLSSLRPALRRTSRVRAGYQFVSMGVRSSRRPRSFALTLPSPLFRRSRPLPGSTLRGSFRSRFDFPPGRAIATQFVFALFHRDIIERLPVDFHFIAFGHPASLFSYDSVDSNPLIGDQLVGISTRAKPRIANVFIDAHIGALLFFHHNRYYLSQYNMLGDHRLVKKKSCRLGKFLRRLGSQIATTPAL